MLPSLPDTGANTSADDCRGGPPGSSMMYPGMGPDSHPGSGSALFHGGPNHPHGPPPPPHHPSHMTASSPMMRMPGGHPPGHPVPPPGNGLTLKEND